MKSLVLILLPLLLFSTETDSLWQLEPLQKLFVENSLNLSNDELAIRNAKNGVSSTKFDMVPDLIINSKYEQYHYFIEDEPDRNVDIVSVGAELTFRFYTGLKRRFDLASARSSVAISEMEYSSDSLALLEKFTSYYFDALLAYESKTFVKEQVRLAQIQRELMESRFQNSSVTLLDLEDASILVRRYQSALDDWEYRYETALEQMSSDLRVPVAFFDQLEGFFKAGIPDSTYSNLVQDSLNIELQKEKLEQSEILVKQQKSQRAPYIDLSTTLIQDWTDSERQILPSVFSIELNWNIPDFFAQKQSVDSRENQVEMQRNTILQTIQAEQLKFRNGVRNLEFQLKIYERETETFSLYENRLSLANRRFDAGLMTQYDKNRYESEILVTQLAAMTAHVQSLRYLSMLKLMAK